MRRLLCLISLALVLMAPAHGQGASLTWKGKRVDLAAPPAGFPAEAQPAVERFSKWAGEHGYKLDLEASGRALVVSASGGSKWAKQAEAVLGFFDASFAPRKRATADGEPAAPVTPPAKSEWGSGSRTLGTGTFVLVVVKSPKDHESLLARLAEIAPWLAGWAKSATPAPGFALEEPLAGAVVLGLPENKEWSAENEFVHRAAELAFARRFGRQPYWIVQGFAWHAELELRRGIFCFPYRSGFVKATEHTGWRARLASDWSSGAEPGIADLASLHRGSFDEKSARTAWGAAALLAEQHGPGLAAALLELYDLWERGSRKDLGGGRWERVEFDVPLDEQWRVLRAHTTPELGPALLNWFRGP